MRATGGKIDLDYAKTKEFFDSREKKYTEEHPYVITMYQDAHPKLTDIRNQAEINKILPILQLEQKSRILDLGCGIGRWADAIHCKVTEYLGIDFSEGLVRIARSRNKRPEFSFEQMSVCDFGAFFRSHHLHPFNCLIISGVLLYLNDLDIEKLFQAFSDFLVPEGIVYLREPIGIQERLTLKDFYSQELGHDYHTIYRTVDEYRYMLTKNAPFFTVKQEGFLFDDPKLNNRKETSQYYFILKRV